MKLNLIGILFQLHYDRYDKKFGNDGQHEALTWGDAEVCLIKIEQYFIEYFFSRLQ
jgi:hypothetical protein